MLSLQSQAAMEQGNSQAQGVNAEQHEGQMTTMHSHDCCDEEQTSALSNTCDFCGDDCQCYSGCHFSTVSVAFIESQSLFHAPKRSIPFSLFISSIQSTDLAHEKRPPQLS